MIILDAFSSDAIPIHLVTREAMSLYLSKLKPDGILVFHISNRYLDLKPVLGNLARDAGLVALSNLDRELSDEDRKNKKMLSAWVVMAGQGRTLAGAGTRSAVAHLAAKARGNTCGPTISPISGRCSTGVPSTWIVGETPSPRLNKVVLLDRHPVDRYTG